MNDFHDPTRADDGLQPASLSRAIVVPTDELRKRRQWARIAESLEPSPLVPRLVLPALGLIAGIAATALFFSSTKDSHPHDTPRLAQLAEPAGSEVPAPELQKRAAHVMADGSRAWLDPAAELEVMTVTASRHVVALRGAAEFQITKNETREFIVVAGPVDVRVVGTQFRVAHGDNRVSVSVTKGKVEVRHTGNTVTLGPGERWVTLIDSHERTPAPDSSVEPTGEPPQTVPAPTPRRSDPAGELWTQADHARLTGKHNEAAALFQEFQKRFPEDPRASLAAFEAARLHQDALGNPKAALQALDESEGPSVASMSEHVLARRISALWSLKRVAECKQARDEYLKKYPDGAHRSAVLQSCKER